ncbi:hypothetical protein HMPREF1129_1350 [Actinomyces naeslundii str. Howell 279]|uniref:Uncharacterized protein n=1 Tax=Actinomyces naeslundii (strain ATCC 12104 / DSM 43013 / CCUG 2238 / JCM 8349 / NCTC 10301 / Howell 279) TaxID=1115803 RepID=J2ZMM5_ACTNH|nr:hypothetical protein HMPREF1129_1350 [Actinomyces naeslundii str. Howell 279]
MVTARLSHWVAEGEAVGSRTRLFTSSGDDRSADMSQWCGTA